MASSTKMKPFSSDADSYEQSRQTDSTWESRAVDHEYHHKRIHRNLYTDPLPVSSYRAPRPHSQRTAYSYMPGEFKEECIADRMYYG